MPESIAVDTVIRSYLRQPDETSADALVASGEPGLQRLLDVWYGHSGEPFDNPIPDVSDREAIDRWASAIAIAAVAAPSAFVDAITGEDISTMLLAILGDVDDPRATTILRDHVDDEDWLVRCNAVTSLRRRDDSAAREAIEQALEDPNLVVRCAAIDAISHWEPDRAVSLYAELLEADGLTPVLRSQVEAALTLLRAAPPPLQPGDSPPAQDAEPADEPSASAPPVPPSTQAPRRRRPKLTGQADSPRPARSGAMDSRIHTRFPCWIPESIARDARPQRRVVVSPAPRARPWAWPAAAL